METGIEKLIEWGLPETKTEEVKTETVEQEQVTETPKEEVTTEEVKTEEVIPEGEPVEEVKPKEEAKDGDEPTLAEVVYEDSIEDEKLKAQKELEEEAKSMSIPEPVVGDEEEATQEQVDTQLEEEIEKKATETEVKEVIEEIRKEEDFDKQNKQWEDLLLSLREDILASERALKEKDLEIKTIVKKNEELMQEVQDLKYSDKVKLDEEMGHLNYLRDKFKKDPKNKEVQKQLALFHSKAISGIYPEFDVQDTFNQINLKRQAAIQAIASWSENPLWTPKKQEVVNKRVELATRGVAIKQKP
jgi:hypothetical protein